MPVSSVGFEFSDTCDQQINQLIEGVVRIVREWVPIARFQMGESVKGAAKSSRHVDAFVIGEVKGCQRPGDDRDNVLDGSFKLWVTRTRIAIGRGIQTRVGPHEFAPCVAHGADRLIAGDTNRRDAERVSQEFTTSEPKTSK